MTWECTGGRWEGSCELEGDGREHVSWREMGGNILAGGRWEGSCELEGDGREHISWREMGGIM